MVALIAMVSLLVGGASVAQAKLTSPSKLRLNFDARIASDGQDLWAAVIGSGPWGSYFVQVSRYRKGNWKAVPGHPATTEGQGIQIAAFRPGGESSATPCIGDSPRRIGRIRCLRDGAWRTLAAPKELEGMRLDGLRGDGTAGTALFTRLNEDGSTTVRVARFDGDTLVADGPVLEHKGEVEADLGEVTTGTEATGVDVALQLQSNPGYGRRTIATLANGAWTTGSRAPRFNGGPQVTGPVRSADSLFLPVVEDRTKRNDPISTWIFSALGYRGGDWYRVGNPRLSKQKGASAGGIYAVGRRVWALWTTLTFAKRRLRSSIHAARVSPNGQKLDRRISVVKSAGVDTSNAQVVKYRHRLAFFYMRNTRLGSRAAVKISGKRRSGVRR